MLDWLSEVGGLQWAGVASLTVGVLLAIWVYLRGKHAIERRPTLPQSGQARLPPAAVPPEHDPFVMGSADDQRWAPRRRGNAITVQIADPGREDSPRRGWVLDRSAGGVALEVEEPAPPGAVWLIRVAEARGSCPWVEAVVRNCRGEGSSWVVGCQFLRSPPSAVLMMFG
jgi:hypothetical protein